MINNPTTNPPINIFPLTSADFFLVFSCSDERESVNGVCNARVQITYTIHAVQNIKADCAAYIVILEQLYIIESIKYFITRQIRN